jgi:predicted RNase H-like nuclease (RuvC/YqgF family)
MDNQQLTEILHPKMTSIMNINDHYDDRLEMEVSSLKRDNTRLQTKVTQLEYDLKRAHIEIHDLRLSNEQLRQAIAVLNDEPTNSL